MDDFIRNVAENLYAKKDSTRTRSKKREEIVRTRSKKREEMLQKRRFKNMPIEKKVEVIKERFGLKHGGSKQNKKKRKKRKG